MRTVRLKRPPEPAQSRSCARARSAWCWVLPLPSRRQSCCCNTICSLKTGSGRKTCHPDYVTEIGDCLMTRASNEHSVTFSDGLDLIMFSSQLWLLEMTLHLMLGNTGNKCIPFSKGLLLSITCIFQTLSTYCRAVSQIFANIVIGFTTINQICIYRLYIGHHPLLSHGYFPGLLITLFPLQFFRIFS